MLPLLLFILFLGATANQLVVPDHKLTFDPNLFEEVIDEQSCHEQMQYLIRNNTFLLLRFFDAGIRRPRGLLEGNLADYGNYHQCLGINHEASTSSIVEGKFCKIDLPIFQLTNLTSLPEWLKLADMPWSDLGHIFNDISSMTKDVEQYERAKRSTRAVRRRGSVDRAVPEDVLTMTAVSLAMCIPKPCTTQQAFSELHSDPASIGLTYYDSYCRLPDDKQWVAGDYVGITIFSFLLLLVIASTGYDVYQTVILGNDPKHVNKTLQLFSVVYNSRQLVTYTQVPGSIECLDGMRALSMMWILVGHTHFNMDYMFSNMLDYGEWLTSPQALWVTMYSIAVDTFFTMSGLLVVYSTASKLTRLGLIKSLHMFYLNRLLRMFPILAATVLLQVSILNRISDGPNWTDMARNTEMCRVYWWSALLHIQNWVNPYDICLDHAWYLSVDMQLHIISPLVLFWLLGDRKRSAWIALAAGLTMSLVGASVYNFLMDFQSSEMALSENLGEYYTKYYINTLTRAAPFFIGMIYGYILHLNRRERLRMPAEVVAILWACAICILAGVTYINYPIIQIDWDNQVVDNLVNSYMRAFWALAVGWIALVCHHGYGGPVNWLLSLRCFKVPSKLSYAMYILHFPLIFLVDSSVIATRHFSPTALLFKFLADFAFAAMVAYLFTLLVDSPCANLVKRFLSGGKGIPRTEPSQQLREDNKPKESNVNHRNELEISTR